MKDAKPESKEQAPIKVNGCRWCGRLEANHPSVYHKEVGYHGWTAPSDALRKARLRANRT